MPIPFIPWVLTAIIPVLLSFIYMPIYFGHVRRKSLYNHSYIFVLSCLLSILVLLPSVVVFLVHTIFVRHVHASEAAANNLSEVCETQKINYKQNKK